MRIKQAIVIIVASLIVGGAIIIAALVVDDGPEPAGQESADKEPADTSLAPRPSPSPWRAGLGETLMFAGVAEESFQTSSGGYYTTDIAELAEEGFEAPAHLTISVVHASDLGYCIEGVDARRADKVWHYTSDGGRPKEGVCRGRWK
jgi:hypothetical protein